MEEGMMNGRRSYSILLIIKKSYTYQQRIFILYNKTVKKEGKWMNKRKPNKWRGDKMIFVKKHHTQNLGRK